MADEIIPITEWPDYNVTPQGGDPLTHDLNAPYDKVRLQILVSCSSRAMWRAAPDRGE